MEQEKQEAPVQGKKKRLSTPLLIFIILMAVTAVLCAIVAGIWLHGRSSLRNGGSAPTVTPGGTEQLDSYTVLHDGKYYRYKEHMVNLLLIGVDSDNKPAAPLPYGSDNQADVILVAALDTDANKMTLISVSRDTMCDIGVPVSYTHLDVYKRQIDRRFVGADVPGGPQKGRTPASAPIFIRTKGCTTRWRR